MKPLRRIPLLTFLAGALMLVLSPHVFAQAGTGESVDLGHKVPTRDAVNEGLFPDDKCKELEAAGFKCMGFKPAIKYSLPASSFKVGSAILPDLLKRQLDVFADVLASKKNTDRQVRIIGHADASGTAEANQKLSIARAEAVKDYLSTKGVSPAMLVTEGVGASDPKDPTKPLAAENRRVEIGRKQP